MTGDTIVVNGQEYEVIWNGEEGLIPPRETKAGPNWTPPLRIYNKTGNHIKPKTIGDKQNGKSPHTRRED